MAKVILPPLIKQMYGKSSNLIYRRTPRGETIVYKAPEKPKDTIASPDPARSQLWKDAHAYAHSAMADPEMSAFYEGASRRLHRNNRYNVAFTNYLRIHEETGE